MRAIGVAQREQSAEPTSLDDSPHSALQQLKYLWHTVIAHGGTPSPRSSQISSRSRAGSADMPVILREVPARRGSAMRDMRSYRIGSLTGQVNFERRPPEEVWTHPAVHVDRSPVAGKGLFVAAPLDAGTVAVRLGGRLVTTAELHALFEASLASNDYVDRLAVGKDMHLVLPTQSAAHYENHSCDPTMWLAGPFELATRRAVAAGEELTIDYGSISDDDAFGMECGCRSIDCRGIITGADWRRVDLQERYEGHWPAGLQQRIDDQRRSR
jgi:hypothetical protein